MRGSGGTGPPPGWIRPRPIPAFAANYLLVTQNLTVTDVDLISGLLCGHPPLECLSQDQADSLTLGCFDSRASSTRVPTTP